LNDHLMLLPLFIDGELMAWCCFMGHYGDVGGHSPGSLDPTATELF